jgi:hypothetical protein
MGEHRNPDLFGLEAKRFRPFRDWHGRRGARERVIRNPRFVPDALALERRVSLTDLSGGSAYVGGLDKTPPPLPPPPPPSGPADPGLPPTVPSVPDGPTIPY